MYENIVIDDGYSISPPKLIVAPGLYMRSTVKIYIAGTVVVVALIMGFLFRHSIIDLWREVERGPIPEAVGRDEFVQDGVAVEEPVPTPKPEPTPTPTPTP